LAASRENSGATDRMADERDCLRADIILLAYRFRGMSSVFWRYFRSVFGKHSNYSSKTDPGVRMGLGGPHTNTQSINLSNMNTQQSIEQQTGETKIGITLFNKETRKEFMNSPKLYLGHKTRIHEFHEADIILLCDQDSHEIFGIVILGKYENGKIYREHDLLDINIYSGSADKYNKYDIKIQKFISVCLPFQQIATVCGKDISDKTCTNIWKNTHLNFSKVFYKGEDEKLVISKLQILIGMILSVNAN